MTFSSSSRWLLASLALAGVCVSAQAQDAVIRKNLAARLPQLQNIEAIRKTPMAGLFEVQVGNDLYYTDAKGNYLLQGELIDTAQQRNLTEERVAKITAVDFSALPLADAFTIVRGNGQRKIAVFEDPNCGYCKRFEKDLAKVDNVTVYLFLYPILGPDSADKSRNLWCAKDKAAAWMDWMVRDKAAPTGTCDVAALGRNVDFGRKYKITGTPTVIFSDGSRVPGALNTQQIEQRLAQASNPSANSKE
ncbi:DsbC family protein [Curvibacter sp. RS43]|uniref:Thiol:disulfide interchange protein n=1 Tax=Curvibacter microcysteis TaxID=3026419 RepID=A0ABT5MH91_9BURK|nr:MULTISPECIES: DsbC family protein [unclassified Curvibacter]MDD0812533.1 DsbC family protein [Curvibacter sp. RS43]MDD0815958.1 DsbC family protein [Curvibacter sp. HBC28]